MSADKWDRAKPVMTAYEREGVRASLASGEPGEPSDDLACIVVPYVPYRSQIAKDNAQAAKDLAHLLRLLGVDSYEEATVVLFDLTRRGHLPAAPIDPKDAGAR